MKSRICTAIFWTILGFFLCVATVIKSSCDWFNFRFEVSFEEILFTITSPLEGSDVSFLDEAVEYVTPDLLSIIGVFIMVLLIVVLLRLILIQIRIKIGKIMWKVDLYWMLKLVCFVVVFVSCFNSVSYAFESLELKEYIERKLDKTTIYEEHYVNPNDVVITSSDKPKNLIYIYLESMETTYASTDVGGAQEINYIPYLTELAQENVSFSDTESLGGARITSGSSWTMGALFSTTTGVPFSFPIEGNSMDAFEKFAPGITSLGDILDQYGYEQMFLCGSDGSFAGREAYFTQHGNYDVVDYYDAVDKKYIDEDYWVWWGYEDLKLYDIAKAELLKLSESDKPFNFTMLTADTHHVDGYICENCQDVYPEQLANILQCADSQIYNFINWCKKQDFYEDTVIIITGDHFRMDTSLIPDGAERRLYNCFINSAIDPERTTQNRNYTSLDLFPTTLAAMGFEIEGNRLGLGTNLFSGERTLSEKIGFETLNTEVAKYSKFYKGNFE